jgi:hypothetical protein
MEDSHGAALEGLIDEVVPVGVQTGKGGEQVARPHVP